MKLCSCRTRTFAVKSDGTIMPRKKDSEFLGIPAAFLGPDFPWICNEICRDFSQPMKLIKAFVQDVRYEIKAAEHSVMFTSNLSNFLSNSPACTPALLCECAESRIT